MRVHPGEVMHTTYTVTNTSKEVFVGQAVPSVTPAVAAPYLQKIECFCFDQQTFRRGTDHAGGFCYQTRHEPGIGYRDAFLYVFRSAESTDLN